MTDKLEPLQTECTCALRKHRHDEDIRSAIEWYFYFKDNVNLLFEEHPEYKEELIKKKIAYEEGGCLYENDEEIYQNWLLKKAFEDVMKK